MFGWSQDGKAKRRSARLQVEALEERALLASSHIVFTGNGNALPPSTEDAALLRRLGRSQAQVDATAPTLRAQLANDTAAGGTKNRDLLTSDPSIRGVAKDTNGIKQFKVSLDGQTTYTNVKSTLDAEGNFRLDRAKLEMIKGGALADGQHTLRLIAKDGRGNVTPVMNFTFTLDTGAPVAPTNVVLDPASDSGTNNADGLTNVKTPVIKGLAEAGSVVRVSVDGTVVGQTTALNDGTWSLTLTTPLADGGHNVTATSDDAAGNASPASTALAIVIDTAIRTPTFDLDAASDTGVLHDLLTTLSTVTFVGKTDANANVTLVETATTTTADANGDFTFANVDLPSPQNSFTVRVVDAAGNVKEFSRTFMSNVAPTLQAPIDPVVVSQDAPNTVIDLRTKFADANLANSTVTIDTIRGFIPIELFDSQKPLSVANFLKYATDGDYASTIFHRSVANFVLQGGGYEFNANPSTLTHIATDPPVTNEPGISNLRGTIALAKVGGDPNSATSEFFVNLNDNSANLDNQNGGFTVFGQVTGNGMNVVDSLAAIPTQNRNSTFNEIPLIDFPAGGTFPGGTTAANYAFVNDVLATRLSDQLTFSVIANTNPGLVTPTVANGQLTLDYVAGQTGAAQVTIRATDKSGQSIETVVSITVN